MTSIQALFSEGKIPYLPKELLEKFSSISTDPKIHSGWPHIKGTRILATHVFRAQVKGYSFESMLRDFRKMDVKLTKIELEEAYRFTIEWLHYLNEKEGKKRTH